jgi:hypothetical protein
MTTHEDKRISEINKRKRDFYKRSAAARKGWETKRQDKQKLKNEKIRKEKELKKRSLERKEKLQIMKIAEENARKKQEIYEKRGKWWH